MRWCWVKIKVGQGPTVLAVDVKGCCLDISFLSSFSLSDRWPSID